MANGAWRAAVCAMALGGAWPLLAAAADSGQGSTPLADDRTLVALAVALACADAPEAGPAAVPAPAATAPAAQGPELELVATVRAKALKFDVVPKTQVAFLGTGNRKTTWKTERVNLPMHPQPGVTYHDVAVRLTITSDVGELAALLSEAKRASAGIVMEQDAPAALDPAHAPAGSAPAGAGNAPAGNAPAAPSSAPAAAAAAPAAPPAH